MPIILLAAISLAPAQDGVGKTELVRKFKLGEKTAFEFKADLRASRRVSDLDTFIPDNEQFEYAFTTEVEKERNEGVADVRFLRPKFVIKLDETFDSPPKTITEKVDHNILFTLSRANQVLGVKDETPKKKDKVGGGVNTIRTYRLSPYRVGMQDPIGAWFGQIYQLTGFVNFYDLGPILPGRPVSVGETWKQTVGYEPMQISAGADKGKPIMGRLDYVFTYRGTATKDGKQAVWISAALHHNSNAAPLVADWMGVKPEESIFKSIALKIDAEINYYLDPANLQVMKVESKAEGGASVEVINFDGAYEEHKMGSTASLTRK